MNGVGAVSEQQDRIIYRVETVYDVESEGGGVSRDALSRCVENFREAQVIGAPDWATLQVVVTTEPRHVMGIDYRTTVVKISVEVAL